jgi:hypothetical protein
MLPQLLPMQVLLQELLLVLPLLIQRKHHQSQSLG